jgi:hypothetical protein
MKKIILSLAIAIYGYCTYAQSVFPTDGTNVGIGTTSPSEKLEVNGNLKINGVLLPRTTESNAVALSLMPDIYANYFLMSPGNYFGWRQNTAHTLSLDSYNTGTNKNVLSITQGGFLGIGYTTDPTSGNLFAVNGKSYFGNNTSIVQSGNITPEVGSTYGLRVYDGGSEQATVGYDASYVYLQSWSNKPLQINNQGNNTIINPTWGNVGIGTTSPSGQLEVWRPASNGIVTRFATKFDNGQALDAVAVQTNSSQGYFSFDLSASIPSWQNLVIPVGNVGIGTVDPHGYKLAVNGNVIATSMTVKLYNNWPDYVFKPNYRLPSLTAVKAYIDQNQHLPEMPSEQEVKDNGINLGEIVKIQTKKIEELTLYLINKDKQLEEQQKQIDALKEQLRSITKYLPKN